MRKLFFLYIFLIVIAHLFSVTPKILSENEREIRFELDLSEVTVQDDKPFAHFECNSMESSTDSGSPLIPFFVYNVIVPSDGSVNVLIEEKDQQEYFLKNPIKPVETITEIEKKINIEYNIDVKKYQNAKKSKYSTGQITTFRDFSYIPVTINPVDYNHNLKRVSFPKKIIVTIEISGNQKGKRLNIGKDTEVYSDIFLNWNSGKTFYTSPKRQEIYHSNFSNSSVWYQFTVNKDGIYELNSSNLSSLPLADIDPSTIRLFTTGGAMMSGLVNSSGIELKEVPLYIINNGNQMSFDQTDRILFYGQDRDGVGMNPETGSYNKVNDEQILGDYQYFNPYGGDNTYWLTWGGAYPNQPNPLRILTENKTSFSYTETTSLTNTHLESEKVRNSKYYKHTWDWFMQALTGNSNADYLYNADLIDLDPTKSHTISVAIQSEDEFSSSSRKHEMNIYANNELILSKNWKHSKMYSYNGTSNKLISGLNTIKLSVLRSGTDNSFLNYIDINWHRKLKKLNESYIVQIPRDKYNIDLKYQFSNKTSDNTRVFKVDSFHEVSRIDPVINTASMYFIGNGTKDTRFWVFDDTDVIKVNNVQQVQLNDLVSDNSPIEYVILADKLFEAELPRLKSIYQQQYPGSSIKITYLNDVYNYFSGGNPDPEAINKYFQYIYFNNAEPKLKGVVLIGTGTIDWRNFSGLASKKNIMPVNQGKQESNNFKEMDDEVSSDLFYGHLTQYSKPEIIIGRIPVSDATELGTYINKLEYYLSDSKMGFWRNRILLLADDQYSTSNMDYEHTRYIQVIANLIHPSVFKDIIYSVEYDLDEFRKKPQVRDLFINNINQGALYTCYIGHGSFDGLSDESYLRINDVPSINEKDNMTIFLAGSCNVGEYDSPFYSSLGDVLVRNNSGGSIVSISALRTTFGFPNKDLLGDILKEAYNNYKSVGESMLISMARNSSNYGNNCRYNLLGDPFLKAIPPRRNNNLLVLENPSDTLITNIYQARQTVSLKGDYNNPLLNKKTKLFVFDTNMRENYVQGAHSEPITRYNRKLYNSEVTTNSGKYNASFIVPDDIFGGTSGRVISFYSDPESKEEYINYFSPITFSGHDYVVENNDIPEIKIYLDSYKFRAGDEVSTEPLLMTTISDSNGVNILGKSGHNIILLIDNENNPINVTEGFSYNEGSSTIGTLLWKLPKLSQGIHKVKIIAFDNFNRPSLAETTFNCRNSESITLSDVLVYPNPIKKDGYFTFINTEDADVTISIFTISGRKIKTLRNSYVVKGYNQIFWDGKDEDGDKLANNTYFYKIKAKQLSNGKTIESINKLIILK